MNIDICVCIYVCMYHTNTNMKNKVKEAKNCVIL